MRAYDTASLSGDDAFHINSELNSALFFAPRTNRVVLELAHENVSVDGANARIQRARHADTVADLRALPGHDDERFRRFLITENRHTGHRLLLGRRRRS